jgi:hypothetical protein
MHIGLIDRPFVPHNLISTQDSPVPLPNFQMATRLKILMPSGSKKEPKYSFSFLSKVSTNELPPDSPTGLPMERDPFTGHFYISKFAQKFL